jgi:hypothetical protein
VIEIEQALFTVESGFANTAGACLRGLDFLALTLAIFLLNLFECFN